MEEVFWRGQKDRTRARSLQSRSCLVSFFDPLSLLSLFFFSSFLFTTLNSFLLLSPSSSFLFPSLPSPDLLPTSNLPLLPERGLQAVQTQMPSLPAFHRPEQSKSKQKPRRRHRAREEKGGAFAFARQTGSQKEKVHLPRHQQGSPARALPVRQLQTPRHRQRLRPAELDDDAAKLVWRNPGVALPRAAAQRRARGRGRGLVGQQVCRQAGRRCESTSLRYGRVAPFFLSLEREAETKKKEE